MKKKYRSLFLTFIPFITFICWYVIWSDYEPPHGHPNNGEVIHVVSVIAGQVACRTSMPFIKSLLFHRRTELHLHIITNAPAYATLSVLFKTWGIEGVRFSFYHLEEFEHLLTQIPNSHHSGIFGLSKLIVEQMLPEEIEKVIVLDTDVVVIDSLQELWAMFGSMGRKQFIGLVENLSDYYLEKGLFSNLARGFNTGVMLLDLKKMRGMRWKDLWTKEQSELNRKIGAVKQADQDIINSYLARHSTRVHQIPCIWNYQISAKSLVKQICRQSWRMKGIRIVHWNSPLKHKLDTNLARSVEALYLTYLKMDGGVVTKRAFHEVNSKQITGEITNIPNRCDSIHEAGTRVYRTHPFFIPSVEQPSNNDVTLIAQLSMDRLQMLEKIAKQWKGYMSIAIYTMDYELEAIETFIRQCPDLKSRKNIDFHIVFQAGEFYPVNYLRNVAMNFSHTPAVLISDADFLPMEGLAGRLKDWLLKEESVSNSNNRAYIVPAFETLRYRFSTPEDKSQLIQMWDDGLIDTFRHFEWPRGHSATNYTFWRESDSLYRVDWDMDFEPYVLLPRKFTPFDQRFVGFGWNKVSFIIELDAAGIELWVLPDVFMIHMPHSPSLDISHFRENNVYRNCLLEMKQKFLKDLVIRFGTSAFKYAQFEE